MVVQMMVMPAGMKRAVHGLGVKSQNFQKRKRRLKIRMFKERQRDQARQSGTCTIPPIFRPEAGVPTAGEGGASPGVIADRAVIIVTPSSP